MTTLSDTQAIILSAAAQRSDRNVLPLPGSLRGGAAGKVVTALLTRGLICEVPIDSHARANGALNPIWRNDEGGRAVLLLVTEAGLEAIGGEPAPGPEGTAGAARQEAAAPKSPSAHAEAPQRRGGGSADSSSSPESLPPAGAEGPSASRTGPVRGNAREGPSRRS